MSGSSLTDVLYLMSGLLCITYVLILGLNNLFLGFRRFITDILVSVRNIRLILKARYVSVELLIG